MQYEVLPEVLEAVKSVAAENKAPFRQDEMAEAMQAVLDESARQAEETRAAAEAKAAALLEDARRRAEELSKQAEEDGYKAGFDAGEAAGREAAAARAAEYVEEIASLAEEMREIKREFVLENEKEMVCVALETANKVMRQQCRVDTDAVSKMLEEAVAENDGSVRLYLSELQNTLELRLDKNITKKIKSFARGLKTVMVSEPDSILLETEGGIVDIGIPTQMEMIKASLLDED
jgi:flagellar assembly protein FliH